MKLPRDVSGRRLARLLESHGYEVTRQRGSHIRLEKSSDPAHKVTIPDHDSLRPGTLQAILSDVARVQGLSRDQLAHSLFGIR